MYSTHDTQSTGRELSFEWSHHRIMSADSKVRTTLQNSIKHSGSERVKKETIFGVSETLRLKRREKRREREVNGHL